MEKLIKLVTDEGDIVLDPFVGSGTTVVAAKMAQRRYIGIDKSPDAIELTKERLNKLIKTESNLLKKGRISYQKLNDEEMSLLHNFNATPVQRNSGIDGFLKEQLNQLPVSIRIQRENESLNEAKMKLLVASKKKKCSAMILVRTHLDQMSILSHTEDIQIDNLFVIDKYDIQIELLKEKININNAKLN